MAKRKSMNVDSSIDTNLVGAFGVVGDGEPGDQQEETTKYTVTYEYDTTNNAVLATLPNDDNEYEEGAIVTALAPSQTSVEGTNNDKAGTFTFNGWDAESKIVNGANVTFTGTWTFTESAVDPVNPTPNPEPTPDPEPDDDDDDEPEIKIYPNDRFNTQSTQKDTEIQAIYGRTDVDKRSTVGEMIGKIVNINTDTTVDGKEIPSYIEGLPMKVIDVFGENVLVTGANSRAEAKYLYLVAAEDVSEVEEEEEPDDGE